MYELQSVWRQSTLVTPTQTARKQSIAISDQKIPDFVVVKSVNSE